MNREQRNYLIKRVESAYMKKRSELLKVDDNDYFKTHQAKADYLSKLFKKANIGVQLLDARWSGLNIIQTDEELAHGKKIAELKTKAEAKVKELSVLKNKVMDEVMLGEDAVALANAIKEIESFK